MSLHKKNFKGFAAGNPLTDEGFNYMGDASYQLYLQTHGMVQFNDDSGDATGTYNVYDILVDVCNADRMMNYIRYPSWINQYKGIQSNEDVELLKNSNRKRYVNNPEPCIDDYLTNFLNQAAVQNAIHAKSTSWGECGGVNYNFSSNSMVPLYQLFTSKTDYKILVYSGDADTVVNFIGTEQWVLGLNLKVVSPWDAWTYSRIDGNGVQLGGWTVVFDGLTYTTIKGAGHMVPWFAPAAAFQMFQSFLSG